MKESHVTENSYCHTWSFREPLLQGFSSTK